MKLSKIARLLGIALIVSLLTVALPAAPALADSLLLSPTSGQVGSTIAVTGSGFATTTVPSDGVVLYFSDQQASLYQNIGTNITKYATVSTAINTGATGSFLTNITIPDDYNDLSDVTAGTHYIYSCQPATSLTITAIASFTVVGGAVSVNPTMGTMDSPVTITGDSFAASQPIIIQFDGTTVIIESGDTTTDSNGDFVSNILIPESKAGAHNIVVTVSGYSVTSQFTVEPDIIIFPQSGGVGDLISISGTGFAKRPKLVNIYFDNNYIQQVQTDTLGSFYLPEFEIPDLELPQGSYFIEAEDDDENLGRASFNLIVAETPTPTQTPTPTPEPDNTNLTINVVSNQIGIGGSGFTPGALAVLSYEGVKITEALIDSAGLFGVTFTAPSMTGGVHVITVTDGTNTDEITYTVESTPPSNPPLLEPKPGAKVDSPATFDWEDATDVSQPVTYALQISSDSNFSEGSVILNKTALTASTYTLTEQEELELAGQETPYYWRLKAIDGASNETPWSAPAQFYVSPPFSFPTWATVILLVIGGIILFGLGYWLGRRTAFFY